MPADAAGRAQFGGLRLAGVQPFDQSKRRHLRIGDDGKAADAGDVRRWDVHRSPKLLDPVDHRVHIVDSDISNPVRRRARFLPVLWHVHQAGDGEVSDSEQTIAQSGRGGVSGAPAHDIGVEELGGFHVRRHQLVPDETAVRIAHVCVSIRAGKEVAPPLGQTQLIFPRIVETESPSA